MWRFLYFTLQILGRVRTVKEIRKLDKIISSIERESKREVSTDNMFHSEFEDRPHHRQYKPDIFDEIFKSCEFLFALHCVQVLVDRGRIAELTCGSTELRAVSRADIKYSLCLKKHHTLMVQGI
jgi:hypothetical protein